MPRKNRQKLHQELRLRAEAQKAAARDRRLARQAEEARLRALADAILRGAKAPRTVAPARVERFYRQLVYMIRMARLSTLEHRQLRRLAAAVERCAPMVAPVEAFPWLVLLARQRWLRSPECFTLPEGQPLARALTKHLLVRWPVPEVLYGVLDALPNANVARVPVEDEWALGLLAHIGAGRSLRDAVGTPVLPAPLTRAMQHRLQTDRTAATPVAALRAAQVLGAGGSPNLVRALLATRLGVARGPDPDVGEPFWHTIIVWLACRPDLAFEAMDPATADATLGWIEAERRKGLVDGSQFTLRGRTAASIRRSVADWRALEQARAQAAFPDHGLLSWELAEEDGGAWAFVGLQSPADLVEEGQAMSHCAAMYAILSASRRVSMWSLRRRDPTGEERRVATVEVALGAGAIVQAKGFANADCPPQVHAVVERWARLNRLTVEVRAA